MTKYDILAIVFVLACLTAGVIFRKVILGTGNEIIDAPPDEETVYDEVWKTAKDDEPEIARPPLYIVRPITSTTRPSCDLPSRLYDQEKDGYIS